MISLQIVQKFINWLNIKVQAVSTDISDIIHSRNQALIIENILLKAGINKYNLDGEALLNLSSDELKEIIKLFIDLNVEKNEKYADLIKEDQEVCKEERLQKFNDLAVNIAEFLNNYTSKNTQDLIDNKDTIGIIKNQLSYFDSTGLIKLIFDTEKINRIIDLYNENGIGFTELEKGRLKKYIGQRNIKLVLLPTQQKEEELAQLKKYEIILNKRLKEVKEYEYILPNFIANNELEITPEISDNQLLFFMEKNPILSPKQVLKGLMHILLTKELNRFDDFLLQDHSAEERSQLLQEVIKNCNQILLLEGREDPRNKERIIEAPILASPIQLGEEADYLIIQVNDILESENDFLRSFNPDEYSRYYDALENLQVKERELELNQEKTKDDEHEKYELILILEDLRKQLKAFEIIADKYNQSPQDFSNNYVVQVNKIKELIEIYEVLRKRRPEQKIKESDYILYLTGENGKALVESYLDVAPFEKSKQIFKMIEQLSDRNFEGSQKLMSKDDYTINYKVQKGVMLTYAPVSESEVIVLAGADKPRRGNAELKKEIEKYFDEISAINTRIKNPADKQILINEQANIRNNLVMRAQNLNYKGGTEAA